MSQRRLAGSQRKAEQQVTRLLESRPDVAPSFHTRLHPILQLHRVAGNRRVAQLIQTKRLTPEGKIVATPRQRSGPRISKWGGPLTITSLAVANATATVSDPNSFVTTPTAAAGNVVIDATLNPAHAPGDLADHSVRWSGGRPGANALQRVVPTRAAGRTRVTLTVDGSSSTVNIHVVDATPPPAANPAARLIHTLTGRANPGADFGLTVVTIGQQGIRGPEFDIVAHLNGNQWQFRVVEIRHKYKVGTSAHGRRDVSGPGDSDIRPDSIAQIVADLTPPVAGPPGGPPRTRFWSQTITRAHEEAHVTHFYNDPTFWPAQMAAFEAEVEALTVDFDPANATTRTANAVLRSQRATWRTRSDHFHGAADAAELPTSETFCHGVSNPMYTTLLANIINTVAPPRPRNLAAVATSPTTVDLTWLQDHVTETGFVIERRQGRGPFSPIATVGIPPALFTDTGLLANTSYTYRVAATGPAGSSPVSRTVTVRTPP